MPTRPDEGRLRRSQAEVGRPICDLKLALLASTCRTAKVLRPEQWRLASMGYDSVAKSPAWSTAQSWNERAGAPVTSNTVDVTSAG